MKVLKKILLVTALLIGGLKSYAQPSISGVVMDLDSQTAYGQLVEIYTDTMGLQYPYYDSTYTDMYGHYSFTLPTNLPIGIIFKVKTYNCGNPATILHYYPYNYSNSNFNVCAAARYIKGDVMLGSMPADQAEVFLIKRHFDTTSFTYNVQVIDSILVDSFGHYAFRLPLQSVDSYLVKAGVLPADSANYISFVPAYHSNDIRWSEAGVIPNQNTIANIVLPQVYVMSGQGYIFGSVKDQAGNPLYNRIVILTTDNDVPIGYRYTTQNGSFSFVGLDYGSYKLFGDALGKSNPILQFSLSSNTQSLTSITFTENSNLFFGSLWPLDVSGISDDNITLYPNPVVDLLHIDGLEHISGTKTVFLFNISGSEVFRKKFEGNSEILIPFGELTTGLYLVEINTPGAIYRYKVAR